MLTPATFPLFVRHFDAIDTAVAARVGWLWYEDALTSLLCDLLDEDHQPEYRLDYPIADLRADLATTAPLVDLSVTVEAHKHDGNLERWVTQADLGLVLVVDDQVAPERSYTSAVLLQAKRLYPRPPSSAHDETSVFGGYDADQEERVDRLRRLLGTGAVQHLLYCPRGAALPPATGHRLAHLRAAALDGHYFDFTVGQTQLDHMRASPSPFDAGLFIAHHLTRATTLRDIHAAVFHGATPFSWWLATALTAGDSPLARRGAPGGAPATDDLLAGLAAAHPQAVDQVRDALDLGDRRFAFAPSHTITVSLRVDSDRPGTDDRLR